MRKKLLGILVMTLLIATALPTVGTISKNNTPNDPDFSNQWYLDNTGQTGGTIDADIDAPEAWDIVTGGPDIVIALIDSGVDYTHPDLADNMWINEDEIPDNSIDDDSNGYVDDVRGWDWYNDDNDPLDDLGHGTSVTGIFGAVGNNNIGITGVCWNCKIMPLKYIGSVLGEPFNLEDLATAIEYAADNGANVISISSESYVQNTNLKDAVDYAYGKGIVLVCPAGNGDTSDKTYPAGYENVIAVAGTDHNDSRMNYYDYHYPTWIISNYGPWVDVAAPGQQIYTTTPTYHVTLNDYGFSQNYEYGTGTSASAPIVSGIAGLLLSKEPDLTPEQIKLLICNNVDPYDSGYDLGSGRVNAYKALLASNPPTAPGIDGETNGDVGTTYEYNFTSTDSNTDNLSEYIVNWGDGSNETITGPFPSGSPATGSHKWTTKGDYTITAKAKDVNGIVGPEGTLTVTMPCSYNIPLHWFWGRLFQRFPTAFPLLRHLMGY